MTWLDRVLGSSDRKRLAFAFAISIALHEIFAGLLASHPSEDAPEERVSHVTLMAIVHSPTPRPTPTPPPVHVLPRVISVAPAGKAAKAETIIHHGASRPKPPHSKFATPEPYVPTGGQGAGAGAGSGAGSVTNGTGGSGEGDSGSGTGSGPCGAVDFQAKGDATLNPTSGLYERNNIVAIVHYSDGTERQIPIDWTWTYKSEDADPFKNADAPMYFQFPPASQRASEPDLIQYIIRYTTASGGTRLRSDCPNIPPPPPPQAQSTSQP